VAKPHTVHISPNQQTQLVALLGEAARCLIEAAPSWAPPSRTCLRRPAHHPRGTAVTDRIELTIWRARQQSAPGGDPARGASGRSRKGSLGLPVVRVEGRRGVERRVSRDQARAEGRCNPNHFGAPSLRRWSYASALLQ
jgi:hypothetical protein